MAGKTSRKSAKAAKEVVTTTARQLAATASQQTAGRTSMSGHAGNHQERLWECETHMSQQGQDRGSARPRC